MQLNPLHHNIGNMSHCSPVLWAVWYPKYDLLFIGDRGLFTKRPPHSRYCRPKGTWGVCQRSTCVHWRWSRLENGRKITKADGTNSSKRQNSEPVNAHLQKVAIMQRYLWSEICEFGLQTFCLYWLPQGGKWLDPSIPLRMKTGPMEHTSRLKWMNCLLQQMLTILNKWWCSLKVVWTLTVQILLDALPSTSRHFQAQANALRSFWSTMHAW